MSENRPQSLPHVLSEYNPEYASENTSPTKSHQCSRDRQTPGHGSRSVSPYKSPSRASQRRSPVKSAASTDTKSTGRRSRKTDAERYEELSDKWDKAKQEVRHEDHDLLREKVVLQQELIRKQDEYAEQRRAQQASDEAQRKEEERAKKQAKQDELQQICKQSLEADKKKEREERKAKLKIKKDESRPLSSTSSSLPSSPIKTPTTPPTPERSRRSNLFRSTLAPVAPTPELGESDDEEDKKQGEGVETKNLPWHEQQLYKLYGKSADYFLHPVIENKAQTKKTNPKLRRHGGRVGADVLWQTLRHDSEQRLLQEDASIPKELKLPEMPRLLDNRKLQYVRKMRHKTDIMYRASVSNQDRTEVLNFNNPLPEFHNGSESVSEYLPSWADYASDSTQPEYMRWLMPKGRIARENTIQEEDDIYADDVNQPRKVSQSMDDNMLMFMTRKRQPSQKQKYIFLSEKDATVKGQFSERYQGERENKNIPQPYRGDLPKSYSALGGMISATPDVTKSTPSLRYSAPLPHRTVEQNTYTSSWQPLSMHALVEYKKQVSTVGEGEFNMGRTKMWSQIPVV